MTIVTFFTHFLTQRSLKTPIMIEISDHCDIFYGLFDTEVPKTHKIIWHGGKSQREITAGNKVEGLVYNKKASEMFSRRLSYKKVAATYSPTWWGSTIGDGELNFSVRNGKRWILTAITATICFWEKITQRDWYIIRVNSDRCVLFLGLSSFISIYSARFMRLADSSNHKQRKMSGY